MLIKNNATEVLWQIMQQRNWHGIAGRGDQIKKQQQAAAKDKSLLSQNRLSYQKACYWLTQLGWQKVKEEVWEKN